MDNTGDEDAAVLSDVEGDDPVPIALVETSSSSSPDDASMEKKYQGLLAELDRERRAREDAEKSKSELQASFNRLKALALEAIKKRDEVAAQRDEALKGNEKASAELAEAARLKDEVAKQLDQAVKAKDSLRSEIETSSHMLVSGIDKVSAKVSNVKNFAAGGLPRSQKYTGLPAVAYGVIKRANEIVDELVKQIDVTSKSRNEAREQMEQRNYEIAIEVSQLEATISKLREEVSEKVSAVDNLEKLIGEKDAKISDVEREMQERLTTTGNEAMELRQLVDEYDGKLRNLDLKMNSLRPLLVDHLNYVSRIHEQMYKVISIVDANNLDQSEVSESLFLPKETDLEENVRASLAGIESIYDLTRIIIDKTKDLSEEKVCESKRLNETVSRLVKEKEHIGSLLRSALSKRMASNPSFKASELFQVAENGIKEAGIDFRFNNLPEHGKISDFHDKPDAQESEEDEIYTLAGALENIVKASQLEIIDLQHTVEELRAELSLQKEHLEAQTKELDHQKRCIEELEEKERLANESVEGLMMDIAAAEEEISRWKVAAEQEAAAGRAVEQEFIAQLSAVRLELEEAKQAMTESKKKLKYKEETAEAAIAARSAAEKSLKLADLRASKLRERVEELTHQLEVFDALKDRTSQVVPRYACWPWQWLGIDFVGSNRIERTQQNSNEMELSEPLL